jgi:hypothetical protein
MPTYEQVSAAGDVVGQNVYKARFGVNPCSDMPQLQAWDDHNLNSVAVESLQGTTVNGDESQVAAAHTTNNATILNWVPAVATADGGAMQGGGYRANRLRGNESHLLLGDAADVAPVADEERKFQLAFGVAQDNGAGVSGHQPVLAVKTFYAGAPPDVSFWYNRGTEGTPDWIEMTSEDAGTPMAIGVKNAIHATGPGTTTTALDPVTKPGSGEKFAEEQWIQTAL